jgi:hypothetical protein
MKDPEKSAKLIVGLAKRLTDLNDSLIRYVRHLKIGPTRELLPSNEERRRLPYHEYRSLPKGLLVQHVIGILEHLSHLTDFRYVCILTLLECRTDVGVAGIYTIRSQRIFWTGLKLGGLIVAFTLITQMRTTGSSKISTMIFLALHSFTPSRSNPSTSVIPAMAGANLNSRI